MTLRHWVCTMNDCGGAAPTVPDRDVVASRHPAAAGPRRRTDRRVGSGEDPLTATVARAIAHDASPVVSVRVAGDEGAARLEILWANAAAEALLGPCGTDDGADGADGAEGADGAVDPWTAFIPGRDGTHWSQVVLDRIQGGVFRTDEWPVATCATPAGPGGRVRLRVAPIRRADHYLVWFRPVPDEAAAEALAADSAERRFRVLGSSSRLGIITSDGGARLTYVNATFAAICGVPEQELLGLGWLERIAPPDRDAVREQLVRVMAGESARVSARIDHADGSTRWIALQAAPMTTAARVTGFVATIEDVTQQRERDRRLSWDATHDALTGLGNRRRLLRLLEGHLAERAPVAVLFCDLDGFKSINDQFGHDAGDRVLIETARRLLRASRGEDVVARLAGDEFVVVLHGIEDAVEAEVAAHRHLHLLSQPIRVGDATVTLGASIGVALLCEHEDIPALLRAADERMYAVKRAGGGGVVGGVRP